eukprot:491184_1
MQNWTQKQGFPLIMASRNENGDKLTLSQNRFLISGEDEEKTCWNVPMCLKIEGQNKMKQILFDAKEKTFDVPSSAKYIHINGNSTGFYCCKYSDKMSESLNKHLSTLSVVDRMCLIRDTKALAMAGDKGATVQLLDLVLSSQNEPSYPVWNELLSAMNDIVHIIDDDKEIMNDINVIMTNCLEKVYKKLGWKKEEKENEDETKSGLFRPLILGAMAKYKDEKCIKETLKRFNTFMDDEKYDNDEALPAALRSMAYATAIKNGGEKEFNSLKKYYLSTDNAMEKSFALRSLGYVNYDDKAINDLLEWIISSDEVRSQDKVFPFRVLSHSGTKARELSFNFLQKRWNDWFKLFDGGFLVQHLAKIPSGFVSLDKAKEVQSFYDSIDAPVCKRAMKQCIETITQNANWRNKEIENIKKWAKENAAKYK